MRDSSPPNLRAAQDAFLCGDGVPAGVRDVVADSWERSMAAGFDPEHDRAPVLLVDDELAERRERHPLARVLCVFRELLRPVVDGAGLLMALGDADGRLLWVDGDRPVRRRAERMNFMPGALWAERHAGTNAPGTALALERAVQIVSAEHFSRIVQPWTCSAAPVADPATGELLGVVDLTGGPSLATPESLALVRATARAAQGELARLDPAPALWIPNGEPAPRLDVLGRDEGLLTVGGQQRRLSRRHSEILALLALNPAGMSGEQLGLELYGDDANPITLRAEMSRLRRMLGPDLLRSRPYRLLVDVDADLTEVARLLDHGEVRAALRRYPGPLLPLSEAPGIARTRRRLEQRLRAAVLASADPALLTGWTDTPFGRDDLELWETLARVAPYGAARSLAKARVAELTDGASRPDRRATYLQPTRF